MMKLTSLRLYYYQGCYYGRGAIQISYNYNYGLFQQWLRKEGITHNGKPIDILGNPNLVMTKTDPPLSVMASLWFYMTPQSPKPSMHDIVIGNWVSPDPSYGGKQKFYHLSLFFCRINKTT